MQLICEYRIGRNKYKRIYSRTLLTSWSASSRSRGARVESTTFVDRHLLCAYDRDLSQAFPPLSVTLCLDDEVDVSAETCWYLATSDPGGAALQAMVVWMNQKPLDLKRSYLIKHTTQQVGASVTGVRYRVNINTLELRPAGALGFNEIAAVVVESRRPLCSLTPAKTARRAHSF